MLNQIKKRFVLPVLGAFAAGALVLGGFSGAAPAEAAAGVFFKSISCSGGLNAGGATTAKGSVKFTFNKTGYSSYVFTTGTSSNMRYVLVESPWGSHNGGNASATSLSGGSATCS